jgi:guanylate kinase
LLKVFEIILFEQVNIDFNLQKNSLTHLNRVLIVISGPSGVGKDAAISQLKNDKDFDLYHVITATTRAKRPDEIEGRDYYFLSDAKFKEMIKNNELLEFAEVYEHYYGVPKRAVKDALDRHQVVLIKVDIQGAKTIKKIIPNALFIFLIPESSDELKERLMLRGNINEQDFNLRVKKAQDEIKSLNTFDYVVINQRDDLNGTVNKIKAIITAELCRTTARNYNL